MGGSAEQFIIGVMSGAQRGVGPSLLRGLFAAAEPIYAGVVGFRNRRFDRGVRVKRLPRFVVSVGNLTAGGTGKTPVVRWLCEALRVAGHQPAVLLRGYGSRAGLSDEQRMLERYLGGERPVIVRANPNRFEGGTAVLAETPGVDVFVLDDGFQHRKLARDFDLVLIDAAQPFGFGHVHPRGLLREPVRGLKRATAVLITRSNEVDAAMLAEIRARIGEQTTAPIFQSSHVHGGYRSTASDAANPPDLPVEALRDQSVFAVCGIGNPKSFLAQLQLNAKTVVGHQFFDDHHRYAAEDIAMIQGKARGADVIVTTEKDWAKLSAFSGGAVPTWRAELTMAFAPGDAERLYDSIAAKLLEMTTSPHRLTGRGAL